MSQHSASIHPLHGSKAKGNIKRVAQPRNIITMYYTDILRNEGIVNRSVYARTATATAFDYMQINYYDCAVCEVWDDNTGRLHAVILRDMETGEVRMVPKRDLTNPRYATTPKDKLGGFVKRKAKSRTRIKPFTKRNRHSEYTTS